MDKREDLNDEIGQAGDSLQQADSECQTENVISSVDNSNTNNTDANRPEMIDTAVRFMSDPKVQRTSFENQKRFLRSKGVSDAEIEQAKQIVISQSQNDSSLHQYQYQMQSASSGSGDRIMKFMNTFVVLGAITFAGYKFIRSFVLPRFFNVPDPAKEEQRQVQQQMNELQNSMKFVIDSCVQTLQTINKQQEQLNALLRINSIDGGQVNSTRSEIERLRNDISTVKSLLLNQNQFAAIPNGTLDPTRNHLNNTTNNTDNINFKPIALPSWQRPKNAEQNQCSTQSPNSFGASGDDVNAVSRKKDSASDIDSDKEFERLNVNGSSA